MSEVHVISSKPKENANTDAERLYWNLAQIRVTRSGWVEKLCDAQIFTDEEDLNKTLDYLTKSLVDISEKDQKRVMIEDIKIETMPKKTVALAKLKGI
jgi:hypothetical protein